MYMYMYSAYVDSNISAINSKASHPLFTPYLTNNSKCNVNPTFQLVSITMILITDLTITVYMCTHQPAHVRLSYT